MKFLKTKGPKWARRAAPLAAAPVPAAGERAAFAFEAEMYGLENPDALEGLGLMKLLMVSRHRPIAKYLASLGKRYSMLHPDVLVLLYWLAGHARGNILEIGSYIGGATIAVAQGIRGAGVRKTFVTVELGGEMAHDQLPSRDIVADLKNLAANGVADLVQVIVGAAAGQKTSEEVRMHLPPESVGLLMMDADGAVRNALASYEELLLDRCWVMIDDYYAQGVAVKKALRSKTEIDALITEGTLEPLGFYGWGNMVRALSPVGLTSKGIRKKSP